MLPKAQSYQRQNYRVPEVAKAAGPQTMGQTGDGSYNTLFGRKWAAILNKQTKKAELYYETPSDWLQVATPDLPHENKEIRHLALAFDGSARHVFAYERSSQIWVRQWDTATQAFVMRGPFEGVDPVLISEAAFTSFIPDGDVNLYFLSGDRLTLKYRVQRDYYAVEYTAQVFTTPMVLDLAAPGSWQSRSYLADALGNRYMVLSHLYPIHLSPDNLSGSAAGPGQSSYQLALITEALLDNLVAPVSGPGQSTYAPVVLVESFNPDNLTGAVSGPTGGSYAP